MKNYNQDKIKLVNTVFSKVYKKYDLMNDLMSLGVHRLWKNKLINWMGPENDTTLIDVASGTGDLAKLFSIKNSNQNKIHCVEPNQDMLNIGKEKLKTFNNIMWHLASAEKLPFKDNTFDYYTISFGIRNVTNINLCLQEAYRVLKTGGRFMCLEFSKIENEILKKLYKQYSKAIPFVGKYVVGSSMPYDYLITSIENFYNQKDLLELIENSGFSNVEFRNLSNGISAIHSGWKV
jgi:demethylmenaquinone methyltransferase / 2-methoxy-6-polyprenyl-1,4-benzoquinol methylase